MAGRKDSRFVIAAFGMTLVLSCATPSYVGLRTSDGTFVHRGYGIVWRPDPERWRWIEPGSTTADPARVPQFRTTGLDLDGDGILDPHERAPRYEPAAVYESKQAPDVWVSLDVAIVPESATEVPADRFLTPRVPRPAGPVTVREAKGRRLYALEGTDPDGGAIRLLVRDQPRFLAEAGPRRQLVLLTLRAPRLDEELRSAHDALGFALSLRTATPDGSSADPGRDPP
jgi:hypothetical protein